MSDKDACDTIIVFTARSPDRIVREGGSQAWVLDPARAKLCKWLVCTQNRHHPNHEFSDATEPHGAAFLVGKIADVRAAEDGDDRRWLIVMDAYARVVVPGVWQHWRNPVRYTTLEETGINVKKLEFQSMPSAAPTLLTPSKVKGSPVGVGPMTIAEAKRALATAFGVKPDAVEITIRG